MAEAKVLGSRSRRAGTTNVAVDTSGIPEGAWMIVVAMISSSATTVTAPAGWSALWSPEKTGTRRNHSFYRVREAGDTDTATFVQSASSPGGYVIVWGTGDWASRVVGDTRVRSTVGSSGSRFQNIAPSIAAPANTLTLAFTTEATTALVQPDEISAISPDTWARELYLGQPAPSSEIETVGVYWNGFVDAQASGDLTFTYTSSQDNNGWAAQIGIPGDFVVPPTPTPTPGTLNWLGNWDARHDRVQVVGKVTDAEEVTLDINGVETPVAPDVNGYFRIDATGLSADTAYPWEVLVDGVSRLTGSIKTLPAPGSSGTHRTIIGSCLDSYSSPVFGKLVARAADLIFWGGDRGYTFITGGPNGSVSPTTADALRPLREEFYATTAGRAPLDYAFPMAYMYSDCDGAGGNADGTTGGNATGVVQEVWRQQTANVELPVSGVGCRSFVIGPFRYVITDETTAASLKTATDDGSKTKLGAPQLAWFLNELEEAAAAKQAVIWLGDGPFHAPTVSSGTSNEWSRYNTERLVIVAKIEETGVRILRANGDRHSLAADDGTNNPFGGFGTVNGAPFHTTANPYGMSASSGTWPPTQTNGSQQYVVLDFDHDTMQVTANGYSSTNAEPTEVQRFDPVPVFDLSYPDEPSGPQFIYWDGATATLLTPIFWDGAVETTLTAEEAS